MREEGEGGKVRNIRGEGTYGIILVESYVPPIPTSTMATSTCHTTKQQLKPWQPFTADKHMNLFSEEDIERHHGEKTEVSWHGPTVLLLQREERQTANVTAHDPSIENSCCGTLTTNVGIVPLWRSVCCGSPRSRRKTVPWRAAGH